MNPLDELANLPLTEIENKLKLVAPFSFGEPWHILSSSELLNYLAWMKQHYGTNSDDFISGRDCDYATQRESRHIKKDHDISVGRMLRYMPAHWHDNEYFEIYYAFSGECPIFLTARPSF